MDVKLSVEERAVVAAARTRERQARVWRRYRALELLDEGQEPAAVAPATMIADTLAYLHDLPAAFAASQLAERNALLGTVFQSIAIHDGVVTACCRRPTSHRSWPWQQKRPARCRAVVNPMLVLTEATGFEPAISALTGLHVRPLHHASRT